MNFISTVEKAVYASNPSFKSKIYLQDVNLVMGGELGITLTMNVLGVVSESPLEGNELVALTKFFSYDDLAPMVKIDLTTPGLQAAKQTILNKFVESGECYGLTTFELKAV